MHAEERTDGRAGPPVGDARECYDRIRYTLSDASGELRFTSFEITGGIDCRAAEQELREYLLSRPLRSLETHRIMRVTCPGGRQCIDTVAKVVAEQQALFATGGKEEETDDAQDQAGAL